MTRRFGYHAALLTAPAFAVSTLACSSGCGSNSADSSNHVQQPGPTATTASSGPALAVNAAQAQRETFTFDDGPKDMLTFTREGLRLSATCARPDGSLDCEAIRFLRRGKQVSIPASELGSIPPGALACKKLGIRNTVGRSAQGNEDGFCVMGDGTLVSHGSVDTYVLQ